MIELGVARNLIDVAVIGLAGCAMIGVAVWLDWRDRRPARPDYEHEVDRGDDPVRAHMERLLSASPYRDPTYRRVTESVPTSDPALMGTEYQGPPGSPR